LGESHQLQFEQSPDLIAGIELVANGIKIGWSIAEYLHTLDEAVSEQINNHIDAAHQTNTSADTQTQATPESKPEPNVTNQHLASKPT